MSLLRLSPIFVAALFTLAACSGGQVVNADDQGTRSDQGGQEGDVAAPEVSPDGPGGTDSEVAGGGCTADQECAHLVADKACMIALCDQEAGECVTGPAKAGSPCEDGDPCSQGDFCQEGKCAAGAAVTCDDGNPCTLDSCDVDAGCVFLPLSNNACDDGDPCTTGDGCHDGLCEGVPEGCPCEGDGDCTQFEDGDLCNGLLLCQEGSCKVDPLTIVNCPPADGACEVVSCDGSTGQCAAAAVADGASCDDGDSCTQGDTCAAGGCQPGADYACEPCEIAGDCDYLDINPCLGSHICEAGKCVVDPGTVPVKPVVTCFDAVCDPATGQFVMKNAPEGTWCDDANACTVNDSCAKGKCGGQTLSCDDGNACSQDGCQPAGGCTHTPLSNIPCDDGDLCTEEDWCLDGGCVGQGEKSCDDDNPCTLDQCTPADGCSHEPLSDEPCDDGDPCTQSDTCQEGLCVPGANDCQCFVDGDCTKYEDLDLCNGTLVCKENLCIVDPETVVACKTEGDTDCKYSVCSPLTGKCAKVSAPYGAPCNDGDSCTIGETCFFGVCLGGLEVACNDDNPCTQDSCNADIGCLFEPIGELECEDGDSCTKGDSCVDGLCVGGENTCTCGSDADCQAYEDGDLCNGTLVCSAGKCVLNPTTVVVCKQPSNSCLTSKCQPATGECEQANAKNQTPCDDGDQCTGPGLCFDGSCLASALDCDDFNPCTKDSCDSVVGCVNAKLDQIPCEDGNPCTKNDKCQQGQCLAGSNDCECTDDAQCADQDDDNLCNGSLKCSEGKCLLDPASVVKCDPAADTQCVKNQCNPATGKCDFVQLGDGTVCDDGLVCTEQDICQAGQCVGTMLDCGDANPCTDDICVQAQGGCVHLPVSGPCNDGNACTVNDQCKKGICQGDAIVCKDDNPCTSDSCDPLAGCKFTPVGGPCDDADACTEGDQCSEGLCSGTPVKCDDDEPCTDDFCDPLKGCYHYNNSEPCDDGNLCTKNDTCAQGECAPGGKVDCDDGLPCTKDDCAPASGCQNTPLNQGECSDGNPCTVGDSCVTGICVGGGPTDCNDGNPCTGDSCVQATGCVHALLSQGTCNDNDQCTVGDQCVNGKCQGAPLSCDDGSPCTNDYCDPAKGCLHPPATGTIACDDGNGCTTVDLCQNGQCLGSAPLDCNDNNPCTDDSCNTASGTCKYGNNNNPCNDKNPCTTFDKCISGLCAGAGMLDCNDNNPCTTDACNPEADGGCVNVDNGTCQCSANDECDDDDNLCNGTPICLVGVCVTDPQTIKTCSPNNDTQCLVNKCVPTTGQCVMTPRPLGTPCNDGSLCTTDDHCNEGGQCKGAVVNCNDGNPCTTDSCAATSGCINQPNDQPCSDNNPCTINDQCVNKICQGTPYNCNDTNPCTSDLCVPANNSPSCTYLPAAGICTDNNLCTDLDHCEAGLCVGAPIVCNDQDVCTMNLCLPATGCSYPPEPDDTPCDDGELCTDLDRCVSGKCASGLWIPECCHKGSDCDDLYPCTADSCLNNACVHELAKCLDDNLCTADGCAGGNCFHEPLHDEVPLYLEDFDDGKSQGWLLSVGPNGSQDIVWSVSDKRSASEKNSLYAGNPKTYSYNHGRGLAIAQSPPVALPAATDIDLEFQVWAGFDAQDQSCGSDFVKVLVISGDNPPVELNPRICSSTTGFEVRSYALDSYAGTTVSIRLVFDTFDDLYNAGEGVYIDDFEIIALERDGCCVFDGDCTDDQLCTMESCLNFGCTSQPVPGTFFQETFESGKIATGSVSKTDTWYLTSSNADVLWAVDDFDSYSTPFALYCGDPATHTYDFGATVANARTPMFALPSGQPANLTFQLKADLAQSVCTTDILKVGLSKTVNAEPTWLYTQCESTKGFVPLTVDLSAHAGSNVMLHFRFEANNTFNNGQGVIVDHIRVVHGSSAQTSCCQSYKDCDDYDQCSVDSCPGTVGGGICRHVPVFSLLEDFDDGVANGWAISSNNPDVLWSVDSFKSHTAPNSFYCGNKATHRYNKLGAGLVTTASPYFTLETSGLTPQVTYVRWLDLEPSDKDCFKVTVEQKGVGTVQTLETICGGPSGGGNTNKFILKTFPLSSYLNKEIRIVFVFNFQSSPWVPGFTEYMGVFLDNFKVHYQECAGKP